MIPGRGLFGFNPTTSSRLKPTTRGPLPLKRIYNPEQDLTSALTEHFDSNYNVTYDASNNVTKWIGRILGTVATPNGSVYPIFNKTALNNQPGIYWNGSNTAILNFNPVGFPSGSAASTIVVSASSDNNSGGGYHYAFGFGASGSNQQRTLGQTNDGQGSVNFTAQDSDATTNIPWAGYNRCVIATNIANSTGVSYYIDGVDRGTINLNSLPQTGTSLGSIGSFVGFPLLWQGYIQQIYIFNRVLTPTELVMFSGYESWYTGKNGTNLPANSPYVNAPPYVYAKRRRNNRLIIS